MRPTYATSREVHSELARQLKSWFLASGWSRKPGGMCAFVRPASRSAQWLLWVQLSQWGSSDLGNDFTLNLELQSDPACFPGSGPESRILQTLSRHDRAIGLLTENRIKARKPVPAPDRPIHGHIQEDASGQLRAAWERAFNPQPERWKPGSDPWLDYFSIDDVREWGAFLLERLPHLTHRAQNAA